MIFYCIFTALINAIASLVLGLTVYFRRRTERKNQLFTWFAFTVASWSIFYILWLVSKDGGSALLYCRCLTAAAILVPTAYFHFVIQLLGLRWPRHIWVGYGAAGILSVLSFGSWLVPTVEPRGGFPYWPVPGFLYPVYLGVFFYYVVLTVKLLLSGYGQSTGRARNQLHYVTLGTSIGFLGGTTNFFLWYNIPIPPVGNGLVAIYVIGVGYAIIRFRLMEFDVMLARGFAYVTLIGLCSGLFYCLVEVSRILPLYIVGEKALLPSLLVFFVGTALMFFWLPTLRGKLDRFLEMRVLGGKQTDRARLRLLAQRISSIQEEEDILKETVRSVSEALNVSQITLFLRQEFDGRFRPRASIGDARHGDLAEDSEEIMKMIQTSLRCVLLEEIDFDGSPFDRRYLYRLRHDYKIDLIVPIHADSYFYGFMTMGPRGEGLLFGDADLSLLETLALQLGLNFRSRQLERRANQTEKLISLGTLAAGLAHELRNPLVSIRTFSSLIEEQGGDPEFRREFRHIVGRDVSRIAAIVENVSSFAANTQVAFVPVRIGEVVRAVYDISRTEFVDAGVAFSFEEAPDLPEISGNYSQLLQVFLNLFQNAIHALAGRPEPKVTVDCRLMNDDENGRTLIVSVTDNGAGIDAGVRAQIFDPFITTKATGDGQKRGMGLGLAIVKRIVEGHHGAITVTSETGRGTTFFVHLPCLP